MFWRGPRHPAGRHSVQKQSGKSVTAIPAKDIGPMINASNATAFS
jgi:hypothetical protein